MANGERKMNWYNTYMLDSTMSKYLILICWHTNRVSKVFFFRSFVVVGFRLLDCWCGSTPGVRQPSDRVVVVFVVISVHQLRLAKTKTKECADGRAKNKSVFVVVEREKKGKIKAVH